MAASGTGSERKRRSARCVSTTVKKSSGPAMPRVYRPSPVQPLPRDGEKRRGGGGRSGRREAGRLDGRTRLRPQRRAGWLARGLERGLDRRCAEPVPVREEAALPGPELEGVAEQRLGAEETKPLPPRGDEAARVLVEGLLQEAQRQRPPLEVIGGQVAHQLARPAHDRCVEPVVAADELGGGQLVAGFLDVDAIGVVAAQPDGGRRGDGVLLGRVEVVRSALGERRHDRGRRPRRIRLEGDLLIRPVQQGRAATEQRQRGRQEERFPSHDPPPAGRLDRRCAPYFLLLPSTVSLKVLATEKPTFLRAGILIGSPVCGLRPMRAFILRSRKTPRPGILTDSPFFTVLTTVSIIEASISSICFRLAPVPSTSLATSCALVITPPGGVGKAARTYGTPHAGVKKTHVYQ